MSGNSGLQIVGQNEHGEKTEWFTILAPTAAQGATLTSAKFLNVRDLGMYIMVKVSASGGGSPTWTPKLQMVDQAGASVILWAATAAIAADSTKYYLLYAGAGADTNAAVTEHKDIIVPRWFNLSLVYGGTGTSTVEAYACFV